MYILSRFGPKAVSVPKMFAHQKLRLRAYPSQRSRDRWDPFSNQQRNRVTSCRTLFLSDLHLGAIGARADLVLELLQSTRADTYVLVGDILDLWQPGPVQWGADEHAVIDHLRTRFHEGAKVVYVTGNHDPDAQVIAATGLFPFPAVKQFHHKAADGSLYLVVHGDEADSRIGRSQMLTRMGSWTDRYLRLLNKRLRQSDNGKRTAIETLMAVSNWALHAHRLHEVKLVNQAKHAGYDGVICGHYHRAALHNRHGLTYANCGDWVDSFTALSESYSGQLGLVGGRAFYATSAVGEDVADYAMEG